VRAEQRQSLGHRSTDTKRSTRQVPEAENRGRREKQLQKFAVTAHDSLIERIRSREIPSPRIVSRHRLCPCAAFRTRTPHLSGTGSAHQDRIYKRRCCCCFVRGTDSIGKVDLSRQQLCRQSQQSCSTKQVQVPQQKKTRRRPCVHERQCAVLRRNRLLGARCCCQFQRPCPARWSSQCRSACLRLVGAPWPGSAREQSAEWECGPGPERWRLRERVLA